MKQIVYRGVEYQEALRVVETQRYHRHERRHFADGVSAKAVFGPGVYLVSNLQVAAHYAICHAEKTWDRAAILAQEIKLDGLYRLDKRYGENELRDEALRWRHTGKELRRISEEMGHQDWLEWTGDEIRTFILERGLSGILYEISEELIYYVCYRPNEQISRIELVTVFDVQDII
ncbi:hypothetical protein [Brevibacillus sp. H7]|uniref:hypothetical protein n=1 Tax=Brevibacillus sp. H7 TaxID=3349138 RepID=UPI003826C84B